MQGRLISPSSEPRPCTGTARNARLSCTALHPVDASHATACLVEGQELRREVSSVFVLYFSSLEVDHYQLRDNSGSGIDPWLSLATIIRIWRGKHGQGSIPLVFSAMQSLKARSLPHDAARSLGR
ncbi:hypothetical protein LIA77_07999 [Sarocladium implicatum]|nr:hypothetical protein LIA77_07999 [Sarocladium implicatum]